MATFAWSTAALGFYDAANAQHEHATLSFTPVDVGLTFLVPALAYAAVSPFAGTTIRAYGARTPLVVGCVLWVLACLSWGPLPLKTPHVRAYVWLMLALNSALIGPAIALMFQAPLPLARHFIDAHRARGVGPPSQAVDDTLAALQNAANSIGAVVGPLVGGFLVDRAPQLHEPGCRLHDGAKCHSGFLWGTVLFTLGFAAFVPLILTLVPSDSPNRKREDDEATDARLEPLLREATLI
ncbi:major facilitator superfamily domain-containing protein [Pelagophyceae sp. CCMP2097]|nr:major facilitator superfamily domain-containing protein [Pelagophyceae sp. CCMP2097]